MPLRAVGENGSVHAFEFDASNWAELKQSYLELGLHMPCCDRVAIPKTSRLGNNFFAHSRKGECTTAPESPEHIYCKELIAKAAQNSGWKVTTEKPGASPSGDDWIADVFCEKGTAQIAIEVQMSPQTHEETVRRQERYRASGVRGAWFFGPKVRQEYVSNKENPIFSLSPIEVGQEPTVEIFGAQLTEFVIALLGRRVVWALPSHTEPFHIGFLQGACPGCKKQTVWMYCESPEEPSDAPVTPDSVGSALGRLFDAISSDELDALGFCRVIQSNAIRGGIPTVSHYSCCRYCNTILVNTKLCERVNEAVSHPNFRTALGQLLFDRKNTGSGYWVLVPENDALQASGPAVPHC